MEKHTVKNGTTTVKEEANASNTSSEISKTGGKATISIFAAIAVLSVGSIAVISNKKKK